MKRNVLLGITCLSLPLGTALLGPEAHASIVRGGFVCWVAFSPKVENYGDHGHIRLVVQSKPKCGGGDETHAVVYSKGATSKAVNPKYLYSETALLALLQALQNAAANNQYVNLNLHNETVINTVRFRSDQPAESGSWGPPPPPPEEKKPTEGEKK